MRSLGLGILLVALFASGPALAEDTGEWGYAMANELMSPYCPGRALAECPSPQAEELRRWILTQEELGRSKAEVEEELIANYGDQLLQAPRAEGIGLIAYLAPVALFVLGGVIVGLFMRRQTRPAAPAVAGVPAPLTAVDPDLEQQLEKEIGR